MNIQSIGRISLFFCDQFVDSCEFTCSTGKNRAIIKWKKRYGKAFHHKNVQTVTEMFEFEVKDSPWNSKRVPVYGEIVKQGKTGITNRGDYSPSGFNWSKA